MILTCPSCGTRYVVKDGAIPDGGRTVRCAQCKHSWHQDAGTEEPLAEGGGEPGFPEQGATSGHDHPLGESGGNPRTGELGDHAHPDLPASAGDPDAQPLPGPEARPSASQVAFKAAPEPVAARMPVDEPDTMPREAAAASDPYPEDAVPAEAPGEQHIPERSSHPLRAARAEAEDQYSPFAAHDEEPPARRSRLPLLLGLLLLAVIAVAAAFYFLASPALKTRVGLAQGVGESPLLLQVKQHSRQQLASGNQLLEVSGLVINPTDEAQSVPPLQAQLRSLNQTVVYKWTIPPPSPRLGPGASASFNSAKLNIPPAAACLDVFIGAPRTPQPPCRETAAGA